MSLQRGHKKDTSMIGRVNEKELWTLSLNFMEKKVFEAYPPLPYSYMRVNVF